MTPWGQVYEDENLNPAKNTRVNFRNLEAYYLSKRDNQWHLLVANDNVAGEALQKIFKEMVVKLIRKQKQTERFPLKREMGLTSTFGQQATGQQLIKMMLLDFLQPFKQGL